MKDQSEGCLFLKGLEISIPQTHKNYNFGKAEGEPTVTHTPAQPLTIKINELCIGSEMDVSLEGDEHAGVVRLGETIINATNALLLGVGAQLNQQQQARRDADKEQRQHDKEMRLLEMNHEKEIKKLDDSLEAARHQRIHASKGQ